MKLYMGIDPSLTGTAISVVNEDGELQFSQVLHNKFTGPERLIYIRDIVEKVIQNFIPVGIVIEGYAMGAKFGREAAGELGGVLRVLFCQMQIPYNVAAPMQLKKFITGKANAEKDHILMAVYKKFGYEFVTNDEADAYVLARIGMELNRYRYDSEPAKLTLYEREVIEAILNPQQKKRTKTAAAAKAEKGTGKSKGKVKSA
jgi:crossover junction endodeoxyribonuclease RuvC